MRGMLLLSTIVLFLPLANAVPVPHIPADPGRSPPNLFERPDTLLERQHDLDPAPKGSWRRFLSVSDGSPNDLGAFALPAARHPSSGPGTDTSDSPKGNWRRFSSLSGGDLEQVSRSTTAPHVPCSSDARASGPSRGDDGPRGGWHSAGWLGRLERLARLMGRSLRGTHCLFGRPAGGPTCRSPSAYGGVDERSDPGSATGERAGADEVKLGTHWLFRRPGSSPTCRSAAGCGHENIRLTPSQLDARDGLKVEVVAAGDAGDVKGGPRLTGRPTGGPIGVPTEPAGSLARRSLGEAATPQQGWVHFSALARSEINPDVRSKIGQADGATGSNGAGWNRRNVYAYLRRILRRPRGSPTSPSDLVKRPIRGPTCHTGRHNDERSEAIEPASVDDAARRVIAEAENCAMCHDRLVLRPAGNPTMGQGHEHAQVREEVKPAFNALIERKPPIKASDALVERSEAARKALGEREIDACSKIRPASPAVSSLRNRPSIDNRPHAGDKKREEAAAGSGRQGYNGAPPKERSVESAHTNGIGGGGTDAA